MTKPEAVKVFADMMTEFAKSEIVPRGQNVMLSGADIAAIFLNMSGHDTVSAVCDALGVPECPGCGGTCVDRVTQGVQSILFGMKVPATANPMPQNAPTSESFQ